ncbi:DUF1700 domain-containing protein [Lachnospiraceae bacterium OttesenSCG-928-E19]|nr:DUF1700 domain-containing protein [Lachnospiraceae bacterium OttesenSCG-928-E19]
MGRSEFLNQLREALGNDLGAAAVQENVNYYSDYISDEVRNGKTEEEVLESLGDPWVIARNIIDAPGNGRQYSAKGYTYEPETHEESRQRNNQQSYYFGIDTWWKKLLLVLTIIGVVVIVFAIISGVISLLMPILVPLVIIMLIIRVLSR